MAWGFPTAALSTHNSSESQGNTFQVILDKQPGVPLRIISHMSLMSLESSPTVGIITSFPGVPEATQAGRACGVPGEPQVKGWCPPWTHSMAGAMGHDIALT